ncbi:hypothetical protein ACFL07_00350 [Pseudomonadota bacterium]
MAKLFIGLLIFFISSSALGSNWAIKKEVDPLTDEVIAIAHSGKQAYVRCQESKLKVYFNFDEYLDDERVNVRYRLDKERLIEEKWWPSATGTSVFALEAADVARVLTRGSTFIIEAKDFRGQSYRLTIDLTGSSSAIGAVLDACGVSQVSMSQQVPGLRKEIALELEKWGPKGISVNKRILKSKGSYDGVMDSNIEPEFALAAQDFCDAFVSGCKSGRYSKRLICESAKIMWKVNPSYMPSITQIFYEMAEGDLKSEAGKLKFGE